MNIPTQSTDQSLNLAMHVDAGQIEHTLRNFVHGTVEDTLNALLDAEADRLCGARRYERSDEGQDYPVPLQRYCLAARRA